mmetsp:Transcript_20303/g.42246  ORF Transcript_20303/g.42246 Transcript_20303/m.42246 type:complete len:226 (-) Transcript_20303:906-1583(-)
MLGAAGTNPFPRFCWFESRIIGWVFASSTNKSSKPIALPTMLVPALLQLATAECFFCWGGLVAFLRALLLLLPFWPSVLTDGETLADLRRLPTDFRIPLAMYSTRVWTSCKLSISCHQPPSFHAKNRHSLPDPDRDARRVSSRIAFMTSKTKDLALGLLVVRFALLAASPGCSSFFSSFCSCFGFPSFSFASSSSSTLTMINVLKATLPGCDINADPFRNIMSLR